MATRRIIRVDMGPRLDSFWWATCALQILHRRFVEGVGFSGGSKWIDEQTVSV